MNESNKYLYQVLQKYSARNLADYASEIATLKATLKAWANTCFIAILDSGSRAKGTAIHLASDVDYLVSLTNTCNENNGGLQAIYNGLHDELKSKYGTVRKQNVSFRLDLNGLEVDVTPARKHSGNTNFHSLYVSKQDTWKQTNIQKHINDISASGRTNEIKLLKIWRELNKLDFPSIYLEYLIVGTILYNKSKDAESLESNMIHAFGELAKDTANPLSSRIVDPANTNNILSDLLTQAEKDKIKAAAKIARDEQYWNKIVW